MATPKINISKISDFPKVTPTGSDRILIDREGKGGSVSLSQIPIPDSVEKRISDEVKGLSNRIDNIASLPEGSTTGDAELREIRVGADGTVYDTAAKAVQTQVRNLQGGINELKGDLDTERNERIEGDTALSTRLQKVELASSVNRYEIDNLKAKAEGKLYRTETVEAEAYTVYVPSSVAPYAEVQKIGGKSVVWNQYFDLGTIVTNSGQINTNGVVDVYKDHVYLFIVDTSAEIDISVLRKGIHWNYGFSIPDTYGVGVSYVQGRNYFINTCTETQTGRKPSIWYAISDVTLSNLMLIDLTQMFGSGNEPTLEECKKIFSADYYPYDDGTIKNFPVKMVMSLNTEGTEIGSMNVSSVITDMKSAGSVHDEWQNGKIIRMVGSRSYTSGDESDSSLITDGTTTYYPLETPTEETIPEIDNYIKVEGGGTLTFESDDAVHMTVPSTDRFVVDLTSTTEETT